MGKLEHPIKKQTPEYNLWFSLFQLIQDANSFTLYSLRPRTTYIREIAAVTSAGVGHLVLHHMPWHSLVDTLAIKVLLN